MYSMIHHAIRSVHPHRLKLELQCNCCEAFVKDARDIKSSVYHHHQYKGIRYAQYKTVK